MSGSFHCPSCEHGETLTIDSRRSLEPVQHVRRRRKCGACGFKFTTREILQDVDFSALLDVSGLQGARRQAVRNLVRALECQP